MHTNKALTFFQNQGIFLIFSKKCRGDIPEVFCKNAVLKNFAKLPGRHLCQSLFLLKNRLWQRCFCVKIAKFLRTTFYRTPPDDCFWKHLNNFRFYLETFIFSTYVSCGKSFVPTPGKSHNLSRGFFG